MKGDNIDNMYRSFDFENGLPPRIYRSPEEIKRDISAINIRIAETEEMLNLRAMLVDIVSDAELGSPEELIPTLESAVAEAREALDSMRTLEEELTELRRELFEVRAVI